MYNLKERRRRKKKKTVTIANKQKKVPITMRCEKGTRSLGGHQNFCGSASDCFNGFIIICHRNFLHFIGQDQFLKHSSEKEHEIKLSWITFKPYRHITKLLNRLNAKGEWHLISSYKQELKKNYCIHYLFTK